MTARDSAVAVVRRLRLVPLVRTAFSSARALGALISRLIGALISEAKRVSAASARRKLARGYRILIRSRINFRELNGSPPADAIAVVVCLWNRPDRIHDVMRILDSQRSPHPLRLVLWNNNAQHDRYYARSAAEFQRTGALASIELIASPLNVGGIGRFIAARELVERNYEGPFIMLDDDQNVTDHFVTDLLTHYTPRSVSGLWAWNNDGSYWNRTQVIESGASADHVGTGGCICDSEIVVNDEFFTAIPQCFLFMEDMWMSQVCRRSGWDLRMVQTPVAFVLSELDQGHAIFDRKEEFYDWLRDPDHVPALTGKPRPTR